MYKGFVATVESLACLGSCGLYVIIVESFGYKKTIKHSQVLTCTCLAISHLIFFSLMYCESGNELIYNLIEHPPSDEVCLLVSK